MVLRAPDSPAAQAAEPEPAPGGTLLRSARSEQEANGVLKTGR